MNKRIILRVAAGAVVLVMISLFLTNGTLLSYKLLGFNIGLSQRDVRVYNNFSDAASNNNTTPDPDFPGTLGAVMALWKGCIEWGSEQMGSSSWGSGGANFDPVYVGEASSGGTNTSNIISARSDSSGSTLAYCICSGNGWKIKFYDGNWVWADGPGNTPGGQIDLQGVCAHEYGHALGLDHTSVSSATMYYAVSGSGDAQRTIENDDINGVKAIYSSMSGSKPHISSLSGGFNVGSTLTISGKNFSTSGNEVWFTGDGSTGSAKKVTGVSSSGGGTQIDVTIPSGAYSGTVVVKKNASGHSALSNNHPFDLGGADPIPDIKVDGSDGPLTVPSSQTVAITIALDPGGQTGVAHDWWIFVQKDWSTTYYWIPPNTWTPSGTPIRSYNGGLVSIGSYTVAQGKLPVGWYTFTFALDALDNTYQGTFEDTCDVQSY